MDPRRYVYDTLYGPLRFPEYIWNILSSPEIQRLREVRLCNTNSLCLTGGANINRYEHSLGTAHLALQCLERWPKPVDKSTQQQVVRAALLHDVGTAALGHSVQYMLEQLNPQDPFKHESLYDFLKEAPTQEDPGKYSYQRVHVEPIYFGIPKRLPKLIRDEELRALSSIVEGKGPYGPLINNQDSIDLDNIDNVYRLAYHIGLVRSGDTALALARSLRVDDNKLLMEEGAYPFLKEWYEVRRKLYRYLLLNPDEFSAKCMIQDLVDQAISASSEISLPWHDVDYQLLDKLFRVSDEARSIVSRLMLGDLYGCVGIYSTSRIDVLKRFANSQIRKKLELDLGDKIRGLGIRALKSAIVGLHAIKDVNKTQRQIKILTDTGNTLVVGIPTHRILIGVFFKNIPLGMSSISEADIQEWKVDREVRSWLGLETEDPGLKKLELYGENTNAVDE